MRADGFLAVGRGISVAALVARADCRSNAFEIGLELEVADIERERIQLLPFAGDEGVAQGGRKYLRHMRAAVEAGDRGGPVRRQLGRLKSFAISARRIARRQLSFD